MFRDSTRDSDVDTATRCLSEGTWQRQPATDRQPFEWLTRFAPLGGPPGLPP